MIGQFFLSLWDDAKRLWSGVTNLVMWPLRKVIGAKAAELVKNDGIRTGVGAVLGWLLVSNGGYVSGAFYMAVLGPAIVGVVFFLAVPLWLYMKQHLQAIWEYWTTPQLA